MPKSFLLTAYRRLMRLARPRSGLTVLSFNPLVDWLLAGQPETLTAVGPGGVRMQVARDDYAGRVLWMFGSNDIKVSETCNALLAPGDVFLDIGANHGSIGFAALERVGEAGAVHLVEPQPGLVASLRDAVAQIGASNVAVHSVGLFDRAGRFAMKIPRTHSGMATIADYTTPVSDEHTIEIDVLETKPFVSGLVGDRPFGVKIDVEGVECEILKDIIEFDNLLFVLFEGDRRADELAALFWRRDYTIYGLCKSIFSVELKQVRDMKDWSAHHDFLAAPPKVEKLDGRAPLREVAKRFHAVR